MLISELIIRLAEELDEHGNIECVVKDRYLEDGNNAYSMTENWEPDIIVEQYNGQIRIYY